MGNPRRGFPITRRRVRPAANRDVCLGENNKLTARLEQNILRLCPRGIKILFNNNFPVTFPWHFAARLPRRAANRGVKLSEENNPITR